MYKDYLDAIIRHYEKRKNQNNLPQRLLQPRPSKIRDECASVYKSRFVKKDQGILNSFFEVYDDTNLLKMIENFDLDKFKPLVNFLKGQTNDTGDKNIELLGWLLDFPDRPYDTNYDYGKGDKLLTKDDIKSREVIAPEKVDDGSLNSSKSEETAVHSALKGNKNDTKIKRSFSKEMWIPVAGIVILLGVGAGLYFSNSRENKFGVIGPGQKECMVWIDDHYERVSCDSPGTAGYVWPLDKGRLNNLHRIKRTDTITEKHIGQLWYKKRGRDSLDYFTTGGMDPVNPNRDLDRLSRYIFDKYLRKKNQ